MKKIILCPNPSRDKEMTATRTAGAILREIGFQTVVCSPFRDQKEGTFESIEVKPLVQEMRSADLLITFGGDGTILHLAKLAALHKLPVLGINMADTHFSVEKGERNGRTYTRVALLDREKRKAELARITGGSRVTDALMQSAGELLDEAESYKRAL